VRDFFNHEKHERHEKFFPSPLAGERVARISEAPSGNQRVAWTSREAAQSGDQGSERRGAIYRALFVLTRRRGVRGEKWSAGASPAILPHAKARRRKPPFERGCRRSRRGVVVLRAADCRPYGAIGAFCP